MARWIATEVKKENVRIHRRGYRSFYWDVATGNRLTQSQVDTIFGTKHYFVPEKQYCFADFI